MHPAPFTPQTAQPQPSQPSTSHFGYEYPDEQSPLKNRMTHSYTRSVGAPTELQHGYDRNQPLTLPPISAYAPGNCPPPQGSNYPPTQGPQPGHYDPRFQGEGRQLITLPSIHSHAPPPQHQGHPQQGPQPHHPSWPQHQPRDGFHPYPMKNRPPHLQQSQAMKYANLSCEPFVPSRSGHGETRALKKISQRRGEKPIDHDRVAHDKHPSLPSQSHPQQYQQQQGRPLYTAAPPQIIVGQQQQPPQHQHQLSPRSQDAEQRARAQWEAERATHQAHHPHPHPQDHIEINQQDIRKRSTSGEPPIEPPKMLSPVAIPRLQPYITTPSIPATPATPATPALPSSGWTYTLTLRQQPLAARACGFGERDRRVIDPPPILELKVSHPTAGKEMVDQRLRNNYYVVHCSLWGAEKDRDSGAMDDPRLASDGRGGGRDGVGNGATRGGGSGQRRLMGTLVASPFVGLDEFGKEGCFFCFPDLSCRTTGRYRLKFNMCLLDPSEMAKGGRRAFVATAMSEVVTVYAAKDFPGMSSSSKLTRRLKEQGCLISVKKGIERVGERKGKQAAVKGEDDEEDDDDAPMPTGMANGRL